MLASGNYITGYAYVLAALLYRTFVDSDKALPMGRKEMSRKLICR